MIFRGSSPITGPTDADYPKRSFADLIVWTAILLILIGSAYLTYGDDEWALGLLFFAMLIWTARCVLFVRSRRAVSGLVVALSEKAEIGGPVRVVTVPGLGRCWSVLVMGSWAFR